MLLGRFYKHSDGLCLSAISVGPGKPGMPPAALPGATRRREARGAGVAGFALRPAPTRSGSGRFCRVKGEGFAHVLTRSRAAPALRLPGVPLTRHPLKPPQTPQNGPTARFRTRPYPTPTHADKTPLRAVFGRFRLFKWKPGQGWRGWLARPAAQRGHGPPPESAAPLDAVGTPHALPRGRTKQAKRRAALLPRFPPARAGRQAKRARGSAP